MMTKVTYRWIVQRKVPKGKDDDQSKVIPKREGQRPKSPTGEQMNQITREYVCKKSKLSYWRMEGRTKPPTSALVKNLSHPTDDGGRN